MCTCPRLPTPMSAHATDSPPSCVHATHSPSSCIHVPCAPYSYVCICHALSTFKHSRILGSLPSHLHTPHALHPNVHTHHMCPTSVHAHRGSPGVLPPAKLCDTPQGPIAGANWPISTHPLPVSWYLQAVPRKSREQGCETAWEAHEATGVMQLWGQMKGSETIPVFPSACPGHSTPAPPCSLVRA